MAKFRQIWSHCQSTPKEAVSLVKTIFCNETSQLTVKHYFSRSLFSDRDVGRAVGRGPLLRCVALVQGRRVDLQHIGGPQDKGETLEAGQASGVVHEYDVVTDPVVEKIEVFKMSDVFKYTTFHCLHSKYRYARPVSGQSYRAPAIVI